MKMSKKRFMGITMSAFLTVGFILPVPIANVPVFATELFDDSELLDKNESILDGEFELDLVDEAEAETVELEEGLEEETQVIEDVPKVEEVVDEDQIEQAIFDQDEIVSQDDRTIIDSGYLTSRYGRWYLHSDGEIFISGVAETLLYPADGERWAQHKEFITSVVLDIVTPSGDFSHFFSGYTNLEKFRAHSCDWRQLTSVNGMFQDLTKLQSATFGRGYEATKLTNTAFMFSGCINLVEVDVARFRGSPLTDMTGMFSNCRSLTELDVSLLDTSSVTSMASMFANCRSLTELDVSNFTTFSVTTMVSMFERCSSLTEIDVSKFRTILVTNMSYMFSNCSSLTELNVSNFTTTLVTTMASMFSSSNKLTKLDVSKFNTRAVTNMSGMFYGCGSLTNVDVTNFNTRSVTNMDNMFRSSGLTELDLTNFYVNSWTTMMDMFLGSNNIRILSVGENFKFLANNNLVTLSTSERWQGSNEDELFLTTAIMQEYHNQLGAKNTYTRQATVTLTMDANGGIFEDGKSIVTQTVVVEELWNEAISPRREGYMFSGWFVDKEGTQAFDFGELATESKTVYAKWIEEYTIQIPAKIDLNSEAVLTVSGTNNGSKTLKVDLKKEESNINDTKQLQLLNKKDTTVTALSQLNWVNDASSDWRVLTVEAPLSVGGSVDKQAEITIAKPSNVQSGQYEGQLVFNVLYE